MNFSQISALLPIIALSSTAVVLMLQASVMRNQGVAWSITAVGFLATMWSVSFAVGHVQQVTPLIIVDHWGLFFTLLILVAGLVTLFLSKRGIGPSNTDKEEYYLLLILSVLGAVVLIQSSHVATLLLGMELMGVALYAMIAFPEQRHLPLEAAVKYLVLSACASALMLFGFALLYAATGDLSYAGMASIAAVVYQENPALILAGISMVTGGLAFKLSIVPFHMWTPDVYQGAPTPVTGFLATVSKGAVFAALTRMFVAGGLVKYEPLLLTLSVLAVACMLAGNLLALRQHNIKRLLAYSSIAHFGYLLVVLVASANQGVLAVEAITFFLTAYIVTTLAAFTVVSAVAVPNEGDDKTDNDQIAAFNGLFWRRPIQASALTVALLSLAGIPLTAGFIAKFYIINVGIQSSLWWLLGALVVGSAIAIYYYLRIVFSMSKDAAVISSTTEPVLTHDVLAIILLVMMLVIGVWPQPLIEFISLPLITM